VEFGEEARAGAVKEPPQSRKDMIAAHENHGGRESEFL